MNERYCYSDIQEMKDQFEETSRQMETFINEFISIGLRISGFEGQTAKSIGERFSIHYEALKAKQASCRENAWHQIETCEEAFLAVDNENAVINISQLEDNDAYVTRMLNEMEDECHNYNDVLKRIVHMGVSGQMMPVDMVSDIRTDQSHFIDQLIEKLYMADYIGSAAIKQCHEDYSDMIVSLLTMFSSTVQTKLIGLMSGKISATMMAEIEEKLPIENEKKAMELYLEANKESIMAEFGIKTEAEWGAYVENAFITLALVQEYQDQIEAFEQMSLEEKLEKIPPRFGNAVKPFPVPGADGWSFAETAADDLKYI